MYRFIIFDIEKKKRLRQYDRMKDKINISTALGVSPPFLTLFDNSSGVPRYCSLMLSIIDLNMVDDSIAVGPDIRPFSESVYGRILKFISIRLLPQISGH